MTDLLTRSNCGGMEKPVPLFLLPAFMQEGILKNTLKWRMENRK